MCVFKYKYEGSSSFDYQMVGDGIRPEKETERRKMIKKADIYKYQQIKGDGTW